MRKPLASLAAAAAFACAGIAAAHAAGSDAIDIPFTRFTLPNGLTVVEDGRPVDRTFGMSWWRSLDALERWSESHPTHVAIFGAAMMAASSSATRVRRMGTSEVRGGYRMR